MQGVSVCRVTLFWPLHRPRPPSLRHGDLQHHCQHPARHLPAAAGCLFGARRHAHAGARRGARRAPRRPPRPRISSALRATRAYVGSSGVLGARAAPPAAALGKAELAVLTLRCPLPPRRPHARPHSIAHPPAPSHPPPAERRCRHDEFLALPAAHVLCLVPRPDLRRVARVLAQVMREEAVGDSRAAAGSGGADGGPRPLPTITPRPPRPAPRRAPFYGRAAILTQSVARVT